MPTIIVREQMTRFNMLGLAMHIERLDVSGVRRGDGEHLPAVAKLKLEGRLLEMREKRGTPACRIFILRP